MEIPIGVYRGIPGGVSIGDPSPIVIPHGDL